MPKRILIINPFGIGDVLFSTPLISAVKKKYPRSYIAYICNIRTREILETNPAISEIFVFERDDYRSLWKHSRAACIKNLFGFWKKIRKREFDLLLDLSLGKEYAFFCWLTGIRERRGFDYKGRGRFLTHKTAFEGFNDRPVAEYYLGLAGPRTDSIKSNIVLATLDTDKRRPDDFLKNAGIDTEDILIGIAPGGGASYGREKAAYKRWGPEKFALLADKLASCRAKPVLIGGPVEREMLKDVESRMRHKPLIAPDMRIRETACLIKRCKALVCNDGGLLHIAVSQDVPTVSIFGPTDERVYGPYPPSAKHVVIKSDTDCRPCYRRFRLPECSSKRCMENISVDSVFNIMLKSDFLTKT